jgi:hypothetical protein
MDEGDGSILQHSIVVAILSLVVVAALSATGDSLAGTLGVLQTELMRMVVR